MRLTTCISIQLILQNRRDWINSNSHVQTSERNSISKKTQFNKQLETLQFQNFS